MLQHTLDIKLLGAAIVAIVAAAGEAVSEAKSWEDLTFKAALGIALIFVTHRLLTEQAERKAERESTWAAHKAEMKAMLEAHQKTSDEREDRAHAALAANTEKLGEIAGLTKEQTDYFKTVTRNIIDDRLKTRPQFPG